MKHIYNNKSPKKKDETQILIGYGYIKKKKKTKKTNFISFLLRRVKKNDYFPQRGGFLKSIRYVELFWANLLDRAGVQGKK